MAKRNSLNRRSSRSSRYTGSAILDPDTDVIDNTYPYWWKNLENNTIARPSTDYNMLSETSRQLDSNSQVESSEAVDGWWKVLDTLNSSGDNEDNVEQSAPKNTLTTSESEEEPRIKKRKLSLRSKAKTHKNNAFFNILNESEGTSASSPVLKVKRKSSVNNSESNNKEVTNKKQSAKMQDSNSSQSSNLNNIVKSKPKIFKKGYKNQNNNIFIDVLQNSEFKVPLSRTSSISKSPKIMEQNNSSIVQAPLDNQSESSEYTISFGSVHDFSHFPVPKAQSTTLEDSTPCNSNKNDSNSDTEQKIMKQKPKLLKRHSRSIKKNVFENIFIAEESDKEIERSILSNRDVVENTEIPQQSSISSSNDSHKISHKSQVNIINKDTEISRSRSKRKSAILAEQNIKDSFEKNFLSKNVTVNNQLDDSIASSSNISIQSPISLTEERYNLIEITNRNINSQSKSLDNNIKQRNAQGRRTLDQNIINSKNVTEVHKDVAKNSNIELQVDNKQKNISLEKSVANVLHNFDEEDRDSVKNRSRLSYRTRSSRSSVKRNEYLGGRGREVEKEISKDSNDEEIMDKYVDKVPDESQRRSVPKDLSSFSKKQPDTVKNSSRLSSRNSNLTSSENRIQDMDVNPSNDNDKNVSSPHLNSISNEETVNQLDYMDKSTTALDKKSTSVSSSSNGKQHSNIDTNTLNVDKNVREVENKVSSDSSDEDIVSRFRRISQRSDVNISSSINRKKDSNAQDRGRISPRVSNLALSAKQGTQKNTHATNVTDEDAEEIERVSQAVGNEETPKTSQHTDTEHRSISQRKSNSSNISRKKRSTAENRRRASSRASNLVLSMKETIPVNTNASNIRDEDIIEAVEEASNDSANEEVPSELQQSDKNTDTFQRKSGANILSALNKKGEDNVQNPRRVSSRTSSSVLKTPTNKDKSKSRKQTSIKNFVTWRNIVVDEERLKIVRDELDKVKKEEIEKMNASLKQREVKFPATERKNIIKRKKSEEPKKKQVHKAYLVNGVVYKVPRLPRPKPWITDSLYHHLWKVMEPKFKLETRVISEKFVRQLSEVTSSIAKQKSYKNYRGELYALMKEMARLGIIQTRNDFYNFCQDFLPYELRVKMVPMLLPGNKGNIPYDPSTLHKPLLDS